MSIKTSLLAAALAFSVLSVEAKPPGTACCENGAACDSNSGTTASGLNWCYGRESGTQPWTGADATTAKCLTNLHYTQNSACITQAGSSCAGSGSAIVTVRDSFYTGNHQLSADDSSAIQAAIDAALSDGMSFNPERFISFAHVADNGAAIHGVDVFFDGGC